MFLAHYFVVFLYIEVIVVTYGFIQASKLQEFGTYLAYLPMPKNVRLSTYPPSPYQLVVKWGGGFSIFRAFLFFAVVYRRFIAQCRLRSVGFTTRCKNISSEYLRVENFKRGASVAQLSATLSAARLFRAFLFLCGCLSTIYSSMQALKRRVHNQLQKYLFRVSES